MSIPGYIQNIEPIIHDFGLFLFLSRTRSIPSSLCPMTYCGVWLCLDALLGKGEGGDTGEVADGSVGLASTAVAVQHILFKVVVRRVYSMVYTLGTRVPNLVA